MLKMTKLGGNPLKISLYIYTFWFWENIWLITLDFPKMVVPLIPTHWASNKGVIETFQEWCVTADIIKVVFGCILGLSFKNSKNGFSETCKGLYLLNWKIMQSWAFRGCNFFSFWPIFEIFQCVSLEYVPDGPGC